MIYDLDFVVVCIKLQILILNLTDGLVHPVRFDKQWQLHKSHKRKMFNYDY